MSKIQKGDQVLVISPGGNLSFERLLGFMHRTDGIFPYIQITTKSLVGNSSFTMTASAEHFLLFRASSDLSPRRFQVVDAAHVQPGMELWVYSPHELHVGVVVCIQHIHAAGAFGPLTSSGTIMVDDIAASSYTNYTSALLAHSLLTPWRVLGHIIPEAYDAAGYRWIIKWGLTVLHYIPGGNRLFNRPLPMDLFATMPEAPDIPAPPGSLVKVAFGS